MPMWIKICGITTSEAVAAAIDARVDAIGFVFSPSVRRLAPHEAAALAAPARGRVRCVAVTRHPSQALVDEVIERFRPDELQTDAADLAELRLPGTLSVLPVFRAGGSLPAKLPDPLLFEGPESGAGRATDWTQAASLARASRLVLAGGLSPENLELAIAQVRPFGVDVSSGVEASPGVKSTARMSLFVDTARAAFARLAEVR